MRETVYKGKRRIIIDPGEYYVTTDDEYISTLLGSCVAACLWDPINHVVGMNHFLLANKRYSHNTAVIASEAGRYGINAMELLINAMLHKGAKKHNIRAKAFGGGNVIKNSITGDNFFAVGEVNSRFISEFSINEHIPMESSHLGGDSGRLIHFDASDFSVYMKRIEITADQKIISEERRLYREQLNEHDREEHDKVKPGEAGSIQYW